MKRIGRTFGVLVLAILLTGIAVRQAGAEETLQDKPNVLFLSSYSMSFQTVPLQIEGIQSVLTQEKADLDIEFMDTKRMDTEEDLESFYEYFKYKLDRLPAYDAVILGDDAALTFALDYKEELFDNTPMVFLGVNSLELARRAAEDPDITGFTEETSQEENIKLAIRLRPEAEEIVGIVDGTLTGIGDQEQFLSATKSFQDFKVRMINVSEYSQEELIRELESIGEDSIVFFMTMFEDGDGNSYTIRQGVRFITAHVAAPVFRMSAGGVGDGLLGGILFSYDTTGAMAAETVERILEGTPVSSIELVTESPNYGCFDAKILEKYGIDESLLPEGSTIINQTPGFFEKNRTLLLGLGITAGVGGLIIMLLLLNGARKKRMLDYDQITGLYSRRWMTDYLRGLIAKHQEFAVFMLDFDDFKRINDSMGHICGDEMLHRAGERMKRLDSSRVLIARFGGDEFFGVILTDDYKLTRKWARRILAVFNEPFVISGRKIVACASMGIARVPEDGSDAGEVIARADMAMYTVKNTGKNSLMFFESHMQDVMQRQNEVLAILREALDKDGFAVVYQPVVSAKDGILTGFEALLRLKNQKALPDEFIPVAEQEGLIIEIGRIVVQKVLSQMAKWREAGCGEVRVSVNFSNIQIRDKLFPEYVNGLLKKYQLPSSLLEIEITESAFLKQTEEATLYMKRLAELGIHLALDDFGSGYSAIRYFRFVPIGKLKLDKSLLKEYHENRDERMIAGIIHMSHDLGLDVVAEGVETGEEAEFLRNLDCDYIQGYYYGKPQPPQEAEGLLGKR